MGSLSLITAHISKARTPIKNDRAQYGLWGCHSVEQHIQHENQSAPRLLVRRSVLPVGDPRGASDKYTGSTKGCSWGRRGKTCGVTERRWGLVSPQLSCGCAGVCQGSEGL